MKAKLVLILLLMSASVLIKAQGGKQAKYHENITDYVSELGLNDAQLSDIKKIREEYRVKIKATRDPENPDREAFKKLKEERMAKIEAVLTPEQLLKWKAIVEKKKEELNKPKSE